MSTKPWPDRWRKRTVVCIASGPSLTAEDCETVHSSGHPTIVTNTTFRLCPWADALMAFDCRWWDFYVAEVNSGFRGERLTCCPGGSRYGATTLYQAKWFRNYHNSGACALSLAIASGASRIVMLGYDCQRIDGKTHWHGDHPKQLSNARSMSRWHLHFKGIARYASQSNAEVLNASRATALTYFPLVDLADALGLRAEATV